MKRKVLSLLLALTLCVGLTLTAFAAEVGASSITTDDGYTYTLSSPILAVETWEHDNTVDTVYVIQKGTIITTPNDFDTYSLSYYTPPYSDNTQPARSMGSGSAPELSMDYVAYMYKSYLSMFQGHLAQYEPADISQCIVRISHVFQVGADGQYYEPAAQIFFRNAADGIENTLPPETPSPWAAESVNAAIAAGLVPEALQSQYTTATTRAEFCALAVALYETVKGAEISERATFSDSTDINVQKMAGLKVVNGIGEGKFGPENKLTREQAATMLSRLADAIGKPLTAQAPTFNDSASVTSWAVDAVGQMQATGIMTGVGDNTFSPATDYTREQSIMTIMRLFDIVK